MNNQKIIDDIKAKLTHDKTTDVAYLETELIVFRTLKNDEVVMALKQLLFTYLTKEEKAEYDLKTHEILSVRFDDYIEATTYLEKGMDKEALVILERLVKTYEKIENVKTFNYYDFEQIIEYILFCQTVENAKKLNIKRYPEPITYYTYQLAMIYLKMNNLDKTCFYLEKALKFNPCSMYVIEQLIDLYCQSGQTKLAIDKIHNAILYAYTFEQLANLTNKLGDLYLKVNRDFAIIAYEASLEYVYNKIVFEKLEYAKTISSNQMNEQDIELEKMKLHPLEQIKASLDEFINYMHSINNHDETIFLQETLDNLKK